MQGSLTMNKLSRTSIKRLAGVLALSALVALAAFGLSDNAEASGGRDCSTNSIIKCGALTANEFAQKARANSPSDLQNIFANYGLPTKDYSHFASSARAGVATKMAGLSLTAAPWQLMPKVLADTRILTLTNE